MSNKNISDTKVGIHILQNKLKNLKEYDLKFGTDIIKSLSKNIVKHDDILTQPFCNVNLTGYGGEKYLTNEVNTVTDIYNDLITKITDKAGCGPENPDLDKGELKKFKNNFMTITGINNNNLKTKKSKRNVINVAVKSGSKKKSKVSTKKKSKKRSKKVSHNIIF